MELTKTALLVVDGCVVVENSASGVATGTNVAQLDVGQTVAVASVMLGVGVIAVRERYPLTATMLGSC